MSSFLCGRIFYSCLFVLLLGIVISAQAQVTEHFSGETVGANNFNSTSYTYNLTGGRFVIANFAGYGWTGTATDDYYADNYGNYPPSAGVLGSIKNLTNWFKVYELYVFPGVTGDFVSNAGTIIIRGKSSGSTQFTYTITSENINTAGYINGGWTYANLNSYSSYHIDELEFEVTGSLRYLALDAFKHQTMAVLPVELSSFTGSVSNNNVTLNWKTDTEVNNYGFDLERKSSNGNWEKLTFVPGNGNSNSPKEYSFIDYPVGGTNFSYRLKQIDNDWSYKYSNSIEVDLSIPSDFSIEQNFPNPFNPETNISFSLPKDDNVQIKVLNSLGVEVQTLINEYKQAGKHSIKFNAGNLASGVYYYKIISGNYTAIKKMLLLK